MALQFAELGSAASADPGVFGGKAAGLAFLAEAGVPFPGGFCTQATTRLPDDWDEADRHRFLRLTEELLRAGPAAIRSSGIGEDSAARSFAGLFETVLGISSREGALEAAARCIRSGSAARVMQYAGQNEAQPVGLIVQRMVDPRCAGVAFSADPAGRDRAVLIEAVAGRGDALVSGASEPERWRAYLSGAGTWDSRCTASKSVLRQNEAVALAVTARNLASRYGRPLDLEWAIDGAGNIWWLQARPITAVVAPEEWDTARSTPEADDGPVTFWSNWNVRETMPQPLFPLAWTLWRDLIIPMVTDLLFGIPRYSPLGRALNGLDLVNGRITFNMNAMLAFPLLGPLTPRVLSFMDARTAVVLEKLVEEGIILPRRLPGSRVLLTLRMLGAGLTAALRLIKVLDPRGSLERLKGGAAAVAARPAVETLKDEELIAEMDLWSSPACRELRDGMQMQAIALLVFGLSRWAFRHHPEAVGRLAMGTPANPTTRISIGIDGLIDAAGSLEEAFFITTDWPSLKSRLRASPEGHAWLLQLDSFLSEFGHRSPMEFDVGASRWWEDPSMIVDLVRAGLASHGRVPVAERIERLAAERDRILDAAIAASPLWRRCLMRRLKRLLALNMPLREAPKHYGVVVFDRIRRAARELGRRFHDRGILETEGDVFFLEWPEVVGLASGQEPAPNLRGAIEERRRRLELYRRKKAPDMLRSDGVPVEEESEEQAEEGVLRGIAVAAGRAEGRVRILREPDARQMSEGDVLVVEYADPGWTPLFPRAAALVMEIGGLMCHAALVAREMGVPSVFGVRGATTILRDGDLVEVDGSAGTVRLRNKEPLPIG